MLFFKLEMLPKEPVTSALSDRLDITLHRVLDSARLSIG